MLGCIVASTVARWCEILQFCHLHTDQGNCPVLGESLRLVDLALCDRDFHALLPKLLRPDGIYSFFHGLAADNAFFHAVYSEIVKRELASLGLSTQFVPLPINVADPKLWEGVRNKYWQLDTYFLPVCTFADSALEASEQEDAN